MNAPVENFALQIRGPQKYSIFAINTVKNQEKYRFIYKYKGNDALILHRRVQMCKIFGQSIITERNDFIPNKNNATELHLKSADT